MFDGKLITGVYPLPPTGAREFSLPLTGPLAGFSLRCGVCPPHAVTRLSLQTQSLRALMVLSDRVLSVVHINKSSIPDDVQVYCMCGCYCITRVKKQVFQGYFVLMVIVEMTRLAH